MVQLGQRGGFASRQVLYEVVHPEVVTMTVDIFSKLIPLCMAITSLRKSLRVLAHVRVFLSVYYHWLICDLQDNQ